MRREWAQGANIASQAAFPLPTDGNSALVTGTISITSFTNVPQAGGIVVLRFQSAGCHIVQGSNITLMSASDFISAVNGQIAFESDGTNLIELCRQGSSFYKLLGSGKATSNQSITSTTTPGTDLTNMTATVTPDGIHDVVITAAWPRVDVGSASNVTMLLRKSTDGGSTWTTVETFPLADGGGYNWAAPLTLYTYDTAPANGSTIYKMTAFVGVGTTTFTARGYFTVEHKA